LVPVLESTLLLLPPPHAAAKARIKEPSLMAR
jgi:hypothetical protein